MNVPLLDLQAQYVSLRDELQQAVERVMSSQRFVLGDEVRGLENSIAGYCQTKHAVGCASGSDALLLALMTLDVKAGDRVLFGKWSGSEVKIDGEELLIMKESDILGVLEGAAASKKKAA